jgi:tetratricopeptide (TPR) repeat protein
VHLLSIDEPGFATFEQEIPIAAGPNTFDLRNSNAFALARVQRLIAEGKIIEKDGAWEVYRLQPWTPEQRAAAAAMVATALEELGQACVTDYVQSTTAALKVPMFLRAANAYGLLKEFRKDDPALEAKSLFCRGRAHVARNEFNEALDVLGRSLKLDPGFACSYNALGVALGRLGRGPEAMQAFEKARSLTPQWALPPLQIAQRHLAANDPRAALPYLEQAARLQPRSIPVQWTLLRAYRILGRSKDVPRVADTILALDRNYAPLYLELGAFFESTGDRAKAAQAYDSYLLLAPNFADSNEIRQRTQRLRPASTPDAPKEPPSLRRKR